jgi:hypothetical protein
MASESETKIIHNFAQDIAYGLIYAAIIAKTATGLGAQGLTERAFQALLDIEPLIHEASFLLSATLVVRRRDQEREVPFD